MRKVYKKVWMSQKFNNQIISVNVRKEESKKRSNAYNVCIYYISNN